MAKLTSTTPQDRRDTPDTEDDEKKRARELDEGGEKNPLTSSVTKNSGVKNN